MVRQHYERFLGSIQPGVGSLMPTTLPLAHHGSYRYGKKHLLGWRWFLEYAREFVEGLANSVQDVMIAGFIE